MNEQNNFNQGNLQRSGSGMSYDNAGYYAANSLQIRLNTDPIIRQLEMYLRGEKEIVKAGANGEVMVEVIVTGEPKANSIGIQSIMSYIEALFNPQIVQGNFDEELYFAFLKRHRISLAKDLMINMETYGIKECYYPGIIAQIMGILEAFMSRLLNNEERKSFINTLIHRESNQSEVRSVGKKGIKLPFG